MKIIDDPQELQRIMVVRNRMVASQLSLSRKWISNTKKLIHLLGKFTYTSKWKIKKHAIYLGLLYLQRLVMFGNAE